MTKIKQIARKLDNGFYERVSLGATNTSELINDSGFITNEDLITSQADWNENNETAASYIKNRTHYETKVKYDMGSSILTTEDWTIVNSETSEIFQKELFGGMIHDDWNWEERTDIFSKYYETNNIDIHLTINNIENNYIVKSNGFITDEGLKVWYIGNPLYVAIGLSIINPKNAIYFLLEEDINIDEGMIINNGDNFGFCIISESDGEAGVFYIAETNTIQNMTWGIFLDDIIKLDKKFLDLENINVSELNNDSGFITNTVSNLTNYYAKTETYTQNEVKALIDAVTTLNIEVVTELPTENISSTTIYLKGSETTGTNDYEEWIYANSDWELIGTTAVDLSGYLPTSGGTLTGDLKINSNVKIFNDIVSVVFKDNCIELLSGDAEYGSYQITFDFVNGLRIIRNGVVILKIDSFATDMGGSLMMQNHLIRQVKEPIAAQDAATKNYVDTALASVSGDISLSDPLAYEAIV